MLNSLSEPGSVDELGIGIVRDGMADLLFPSTSTLLTKARYFFLVPYLSRLLEEGQDGEKKDARELRDLYNRLERKCAEGMLAREEASEGIIGRAALSNKHWVLRGPGELYWASIRSLGILRQGPSFPDSFFSQFSYLSEARMRTGEQQYEGSDGLKDDERALLSMWNLPRACYDEWRVSWDDWKNQASIRLTQDEARFLRAQIITCHPDSLYSLILRDEQLRKLATAVLYGGDENLDLGDSSFHTFLHNGGLTRIWQLSPKTAKVCVLADCFSELVLGCRIAYNMQLAGLKEEGEQEWEAFRPRAGSVAENVNLAEICAALGLQEHQGFMRMRAFLERARECMANDDTDGLKKVIERREADIKGTRKKIGRTDAGDYAWRGGRRLPYRFTYGMSIVREIEEAGGCDA